MIHQIFLVFAALLVVFLPFSSVHGYGEKYTTPQKATVDCSKAPTPISWHVHVTYMLTNDEQIKDVQEFREEAMKYWAPLLGDDPICRGTTFDPSGRYDNGRFCFIEDHNFNNDTLGPFAVGEWSVWVPVHSFGAIVPWFTQHRGQYNLLVHPNTGCEYEDHSIWAQWTGSSWNMDMSIFTQGTQTNEFGEPLGTVRNPSCAATQEVCAFGDVNSASYAPSVLCCAGTSCNCDDASTSGKCYCK